MKIVQTLFCIMAGCFALVGIILSLMVARMLIIAIREWKKKRDTEEAGETEEGRRVLSEDVGQDVD